MKRIARTGVPVIAAIVAAIVAIVAALMMLGSPARAREHRLDDLRVEDLGKLSRALDRYWTKHGALPDTVDSLVSTELLDRIPTDPVTHVRYPIHLTGEHSYRLCATFAQPMDTTDHIRSNDFDSAYRGRHAWQHGAGESCFDLNAKRLKYPTDPPDDPPQP